MQGLNVLHELTKKDTEAVLFVSWYWLAMWALII